MLIGVDACWLCGGYGQIKTGETERTIACGMCSGAGTADITPATPDEMVAMIAATPGVERRTLTEAEINAAVAKFGPIIEQALDEESEH